MTHKSFTKKSNEHLKLDSGSKPSPFRGFSTSMWQNAHVSNMWHAMVCDKYFSFSKIL